MKNLEVIAIVGPTASGKTALSVKLAKEIGGEIINGDAMQVYKGLNIGTAKITKEEMEGVPHHLFDTKEPIESFSVAEYQKEVRGWIENIQERNKIPIIVGGTGLYVQSVLYDFRFTEEAADEAVRNRLEQELERLGSDQLYERLVKLDPISAEKIHPNNHRRLIRALEILEVTGETKKSHEKEVGHKQLYTHIIIGLDLERQHLYDRINKRVEEMIGKGLLEEARGLWEKGIVNVQSVQSIGYKEIYQYLRGELTLEDSIDLIKKNTRNYAKRQMTYFRNKLPVHWFDVEMGNDKMMLEILKILKDFESTKRM